MHPPICHIFTTKKSGDKSGFGDKSGEIWQIGSVKDFMRTIFSSIGSNLWKQKFTVFKTLITWKSQQLQKFWTLLECSRQLSKKFKKDFKLRKVKFRFLSKFIELKTGRKERPLWAKVMWLNLDWLKMNC